MKQIVIFTATLLFWVSTGIGTRAQDSAPPPAPEAPMRSAVELDQMLGPIALYPDPLIGEILPAATSPSELVLADRYVNGGGDPNLVDQQPWDASLQALARYPAVLKWMDDNLGWTTALGLAFQYQPSDVMDSIQRLRAAASALGNLTSNPQENVIVDDGSIEILPADPQVIYVPNYQPDMVYFQQASGNPFITFGMGCPVGIWLNHDFDWHNHHLVVWGSHHPRPTDWWVHRPGGRPPTEWSHTTVWQPRNHPVQAGGGLDRGWTQPARSAVIAVGGPSRPAANGVRSGGITVFSSPSGPEGRREAPASPVRRPNPVAVERATSAPRAPAASGALIGIQSSHQTQQFSNRGQESRQTTVSHPTPAPAAPTHSAPAAPATHSSGGGKH